MKKLSLLLFLSLFSVFLCAQETKPNEVCAVFQYGGESKLALLFPKVNVKLYRPLGNLHWYYGGEVGLHTHLVGAYGSLSPIVGISNKNWNLESSYSFFWTTAVQKDTPEQSGPYQQTLLNYKIGYLIQKVRLKAGMGYLLSENIPSGQDRVPLLDFGKTGNWYWGAELEIILN